MWHESFLKDRPDGKLTLQKKDLVKVYAKLFPHGNAKKFCNILFSSIDLDQSRDLDFTEFLIALSFASEKDFNQKLRMIFHLIDIDNDGSIKKKEITRVINSIDELLNKNSKHKDQTNLKVDAFFRLVPLTTHDQMNVEEFIEANLKDPFIINFVYLFY